MIELIIPPNPYLDDDIRNPPLGLLYIAAIMENLGYSIRIVDLRGKADLHLIGDADIYGITASTPDYLLSLEIARIIKAKNKHCWTVLGGAHATAVPQTIDPKFDKVVVGEGELAFWKVVRDFYASDNSRRFYSHPYIENLDSIPFPSRHLLPTEAAFSRNALFIGKELTGTIITSRGCPFNCDFCSSNTMWGNKVRFRSPRNVVAEIEQIIHNYGVKALRFQDDTIALNKSRFRQLCEMIELLGIRWRAHTRVDVANLETLHMMRRAGCEEVGYGIESLSQNVLNKNNKNISLSDIHLALRNTKIAGLQCRLFFIIGLPGEPLGFADRLERFIDEYEPEGVDISTFVPYPGSPIFYQPEKYGIKLKGLKEDQFHMTLGLKGDEADQPLTFVHDVMTEAQIIKERKKALEIIRQRRLVKNF